MKNTSHKRPSFEWLPVFVTIAFLAFAQVFAVGCLEPEPVSSPSSSSSSSSGSGSGTVTCTVPGVCVVYSQLDSAQEASIRSACSTIVSSCPSGSAGGCGTSGTGQYAGTYAITYAYGQTTSYVQSVCSANSSTYYNP